MPTFTRRKFLAGLGGLALGLPWLEHFSRRAGAAPVPGGPRRVIVVTYAMGVPGGVWRPSAPSAFTLPYVTAPLEPFRNRCLFVSDLDNPMLEEGGGGFVHGHPGKSEAALTGTLTSGAFPTTNSNHVDQILANALTEGGANAESVETRIGRFLRTTEPFPSVDLAVDGDIVHGASPGIVASRFSFEGRDTAVSLDGDPRAAFDRYFAQIPDPNDVEAIAALRALRTRNKSVLDAVRTSFGDLARDLGTDDRRRLDEHAARIRQIEIDAVGGGCARPTGITTVNGANMATIASLQIRQLAQAMACNLAPVGRLEFANQQSPRFGVPLLDDTLNSVSNYDWHAMVHGDPLPGTPGDAYLRPGRVASVTTYDERLQAGYRFFVQQFANLLAELDLYPEGEGTTVLDNSLVILATDLGEGLGHYHGKMGYILAGNLLGARRDYHLQCAPNSDIYTPSTYDVNQLLNSILDMAGVTDDAGAPVSDFGLRGYLTKVGRPRRIDGLFA
ncbi:MAG: DUF1552 domain-containing protein [Kofleriaceae bacterium]|nr:DUF1552 domain-containing protein [Kofleriaceae bacterium]MBP6836630.1 DUF1552 domain-containing protein [Kofleriaceae bacterium]MBP9206270.1 DUF1552 domain-containing protein [Kofleriaceae bacterium]